MTKVVLFGAVRFKDRAPVIFFYLKSNWFSAAFGFQRDFVFATKGQSIEGKKLDCFQHKNQTDISISNCNVLGFYTF